MSSRIIYGQELAIDPVKHAYTYAGDFVPGVTTILGVLDKPALKPWAARMASEHWHLAITGGRTDYDNILDEAKNAHAKKSQAAADIGTNVHHYAEVFFKNQLAAAKGEAEQPLPELLTDEAKRGVEGFHDWLATHKVSVKASERLVFSKEFYYAGTCDFIADIDGVLSVGDIKTSSGIYPEARWQTAAYQHALQEEKNMKFAVRWIVRFDKGSGKFQAKPFYDFDLDFAVFAATLSVHRAIKAASPPKRKAKAG